MKKSWLIVVGILVFSSFAFAEDLLASGEAVVSTVSDNSSIQTGNFISNNSGVGFSLLALAIIFGLVYWLVERNKKKVKK